jgi:DNA-binding GntR family transcriptional regulator
MATAKTNGIQGVFLASSEKLTRNATDVTVELIREAIFDGRLNPGDRLKEEELAQGLGISRTPVREALLVLQAEGLVVSAPNRGAVVRSYAETEMLDLYDLRSVLEGFAARRAAGNMTDRQLSELERTCERFTRANLERDRRAVSKENLRFHNAITEAAETTKLPDLVRIVCEVPLVYQAFNWFTAEETEESDRSHRRVLAALRAHDPDRAELSMREHVLEGRDFVLAHLRANHQAWAQDEA